MKRQISNTNMSESTWFIIAAFSFFIIVDSFIYWITSVHPFNTPVPVSLILLAIFPFFFYLFIGRFSKVEIDDTNLYYNGIFKKGQIPLQNIISVNPEFLPYNTSFKRSFGVTIKYVDANNQKKKIQFLSKEIGLFDDSEKIKEIVELRRIIKRIVADNRL